MKYSVIMSIYNTCPIVQQSIAGLLACSARRHNREVPEALLVDNQGPDRAIMQEMLKEAALYDGVSVVVPSVNLGCHEGWNFGYRMSRGDYVVKLDDDTVVQTPGWLFIMSNALDNIPELGFIAADIDAKAHPGVIREINGIDIEIVENRPVGFSCVMFRREDIERWGPMKTAPYKFAYVENRAKGDRLYGGEEVYYAQLALDEGKIIGYLPSVKAHHLGNEGRHPDYAFWKRCYGFYGWTDKPMEQWITDGDYIDDYKKAIYWEGSFGGSETLRSEWRKRLAEIEGG